MSDVAAADARGIALDPESPRRHFEVATHLAKNGHPTEAIAELRKALELWKSQQPTVLAAHEFDSDCEERIKALAAGEPWKDQ